MSYRVLLISPGGRCPAAVTELYGRGAFVPRRDGVVRVRHSARQRARVRGRGAHGARRRQIERRRADARARVRLRVRARQNDGARRVRFAETDDAGDDVGRRRLSQDGVRAVPRGSAPRRYRGGKDRGHEAFEPREVDADRQSANDRGGGAQIHRASGDGPMRAEARRRGEHNKHVQDDIKIINIFTNKQ